MHSSNTSQPCFRWIVRPIRTQVCLRWCEPMQCTDSERLVASGSVTSTSPNGSRSSVSSSSNGNNIGAITGSAIGGAVALFVIVGLVVWFVRRRETRCHASLLDVTGTTVEPTPFEEQPDTGAPQEPLDRYIPQNRPRSTERLESESLLPSLGPPSTASSGGPSVHPGGQEEVLWLCTRSEVEGFRGYMQNVHSEAPPEYS